MQAREWSKNRTGYEPFGEALGLLRLVLIGSLLVGGGPLAAGTQAWAQSGLPGMTIKLEKGEVNAVGSKGIRISGKDYGVAGHAEIKGSGGAPMRLEDVRPGDLVQFHVKKSQIVLMIVQEPH